MRKNLTPWSVQKFSDIGLFLRKRNKPFKRGQLRTHFRILASFGRSVTRVNELKAFVRISPESLGEFLKREFGIKVKIRSNCDELIKKTIGSGFGRTYKSWEKLTEQMHSKAKAKTLSKKEFTYLFKNCALGLEASFKTIAENLHSASEKGFVALGKKLGFQIICERVSFTPSAELKALLSEALQNSSINIGSTQEVSDIANRLLSIVSDDEKVLVLRKAQRVGEEKMRGWLGISKRGVPEKRMTKRQLFRKHGYLKSEFSQRAREKQNWRREKAAFQGIESE